MAGLALGMAGSVALAGLFTAAWPIAAMGLVGAVLSATAMSWHGILLSETARLAPFGSAGARRDLYEILEERYGRRSTILTSQIPVDKWHAFIGDPTYADAILDRLVHNAHRIDLAGESLRRKRFRLTTKD
jgi:hypothetical protein